MEGGRRGRRGKEREMEKGGGERKRRGRRIDEVSRKLVVYIVFVHLLFTLFLRLAEIAFL